MSKPKAVLLSDVHFTLSTLELATDSFLQAEQKADELDVPLIIAGDLVDGKSVLQAKVVNRLISLFYNANSIIYVIIGNHDLLNEKEHDHSLNFLGGLCHIVSSKAELDYLPGVYAVPYRSDPNSIIASLYGVPTHSTLVMHTGVHGADMGHYVKDTSSLPASVFENYRVISGHYHRRQDIVTNEFSNAMGHSGVFSYIGNPYTLTFGEANHPPKGFQILNDDGSLTPVLTNLRKHIIVERDVGSLYNSIDNYVSGDLVWLKVTGPTPDLDKLSKKEIGEKLGIGQNFKFDKIYTDSAKLNIKTNTMTDSQILDAIIENSDNSPTDRINLKNLWRTLENR